MFKKGYLIFVVSILAIVLCGCNKSRVCFKTVCVDAQLALTADVRQKGLMYRKYLEKRSGMLFVMPETAQYGFWMKNMFIPLDIIWIDGEKRVVDIYRNAQPCGKKCPTIYPEAKAKYVLEVNAGFTQEYGIKRGDFVSLAP